MTHLSYDPNIVAKPGRKTKLTPEIQLQIVINLASGVHKTIAANCAGVGTRTFMDWMRKGKERKGKRFIAFRHAVLEAEHRAEMVLVAATMRHSLTDGKVALELLARRHPKRWAKKDQLEIYGKAGKPIELSADAARESVMRQLSGLAAARLTAGVPEDEGPEGASH